MGSGDVAPFHRFARLYDLWMYSASGDVLREGVERARRPVERVLDVGGGTGRASRALDGYECLVVDAARGMLGRARGHGLAAVQGDAGRLPIAAGSADAVLVVDALHHMADPDAVVGEAERVLRPGGVLVIREFDPDTIRGRGLVAAEHLVGLDSEFYAADELAERVGAAGFDVTVPDRGFGYTVVGVTGERTSQGDAARRSTR